ncbi:hypothetical protein AVEN_222117-1 [Araneus ventricosus]|uniref:Uncharacterized protein n=1 Tax=Araneus ventricosus TaxID=182803 RepID=A0A4Y2DWP9_ARAVE|nr:hypothetical protein AVEN_222117-1 [Araneus ventricosus]
MFQAAKGFIKEDLLLKRGETLPRTAMISEFKDIILKSKEYSEDPDFVASASILITAVADRKQKEEERKIREEEEKSLKEEESKLRQEEKRLQDQR